MTTPDPQATPFQPEEPAQVPAPEVPASEVPASEVPAVPAPEVPASEAPAFPQASAPVNDEATATPGSTTYGTAYDAPAASPYAQPEQGYGVPGPDANAQGAYGANAYGQPGYEQAAYGQPGYEQAAYAAGQQAYGQPAYAQPVFATAPKQWIVAVLLAFFLGGFGGHNFYLGYTTKGIIQVILTITVIGAPISGVWAFIEFIMILARSGSYAYDAQGQPLQ